VTCTIDVVCRPVLSVKKEVKCSPGTPLPDPVCADSDWLTTATGISSGTDFPAFCYKITVCNSGNEAATVTVTDADIIGGSVDITVGAATKDPVTDAIIPTCEVLIYQKTWTSNGDHTDTVSVTGVGVDSDATAGLECHPDRPECETPGSDSVTVTVVPISIDCTVELTSTFDLGASGDSDLLLPPGGSSIVDGFKVQVCNTGDAALIVNISYVATGVGLENCAVVDENLVDLVVQPDITALFIDAGQCTNIVCDLIGLTCEGNIIVTAVGTATASEAIPAPCLYKADGTKIANVETTCEGNIACQQPSECRTTGGGTLYDGDVNDNCVTVTTTLFPDPLLVDHISHGGQMGAPYANQDCADLLGDPCIRGQWQHTRHYKGKGNPRHIIESDFHSQTPKGSFDTLKCACLACCPDGAGTDPVGGGDSGVFHPNGKYELCNPDDHKICGPQPRPAPANALIWSGMGTGKFITDGTTAGAANKLAEWLIIRVYVEDRSEPGGFHPKGSVDPADIYVFQAWRTGILVAKKADPNALAFLDTLMPGSTVTVGQFRAALSADSCAFIDAVSPTGTCPPGTLPPSTVAGIGAAVYDQGALRNGNRQIHPVTGATCTAEGGIPVNFEYPLPTAPYCAD